MFYNFLIIEKGRYSHKQISTLCNPLSEIGIIVHSLRKTVYVSEVLNGKVT